MLQHLCNLCSLLLSKLTLYLLFKQDLLSVRELPVLIIGMVEPKPNCLEPPLDIWFRFRGFLEPELPIHVPETYLPCGINDIKPKLIIAWNLSELYILCFWVKINHQVVRLQVVEGEQRDFYKGKKKKKRIKRLHYKSLEYLMKFKNLRKLKKIECCLVGEGDD